MRTAAFRSFLIVAALALTMPVARAQTLPEFAGVLAVIGGFCEERELVDELTQRYAASPEFRSERRYRMAMEPRDTDAKACAWVRKSALDLRAIDSRHDVVPWPALADSDHARDIRTLFAREAGGDATEARSCGLIALAVRLEASYRGDTTFQEEALLTQQHLLDANLSPRCDAIEYLARNLIVQLQELEYRPTTPTPPESPRVHCLLPGLRTTMPMTADICSERHGKAYDAFTRVDQDYDPGKRPR